MTLVNRIDTVFVPARDTAQAADWYCRMFSMSRIFESAGYVGLRFDGEGRGETALTLYPAERIDRDAHYAFNFSTDDPEALRDALLAEGVEATEIRASGPLRHFDFRDISGNWVNVCHLPAGG
ncbi:VOC family protein [Oricola thermophila]|uniref:VOC family protein n=1 Tax=Oricola thermophila TaxID=2742145 RepID=A0A6N1VAY9_9HYPH|nr:VOC family protein [Oricola thermophila]QKV17693.1 VOC family protein [Oricola thermophila]